MAVQKQSLPFPLFHHPEQKLEKATGGPGGIEPKHRKWASTDRVYSVPGDCRSMFPGVWIPHTFAQQK